VLVAAVKANAATLVQMPPHRYYGCTPKGSVTFRRHTGNVNCGGVYAPGCTYTRGKTNIIDLPTDVDACVLRKMKQHEMAHTCGWPVSHPGVHWESCP
jgi:hypothetical protein